MEELHALVDGRPMGTLSYINDLIEYTTRQLVGLAVFTKRIVARHLVFSRPPSIKTTAGHQQQPSSICSATTLAIRRSTHIVSSMPKFSTG